jgi:hypothetical protein
LPLNPPPSPISLAGSVAGQSVAVELGFSPTGQISINDTLVRQLALRQSGQIAFSDFYNRATFENGSFFNGFTSWTTFNQRIYLGGNGGNTTILGCPTPSDPTAPTLDGGTMSNPNVFTSTIQSNGGVSGTLPWAQLQIGTVTLQNAGGIVYGPAIVSQYPVLASPGDRISFDWTAFSSLGNASQGDAYNIYSYIIDPSQSCRVIPIIDATSSAFNIARPWGKTTRIFNAGEGGSYFFVFIAGTYDATFGRVVGSRLGVTDIKLERAGTF